MDQIDNSLIVQSSASIKIYLSGAEFQLIDAQAKIRSEKMQISVINMGQENFSPTMDSHELSIFNTAPSIKR